MIIKNNNHWNSRWVTFHCLADLLTWEKPLMQKNHQINTLQASLPISFHLRTTLTLIFGTIYPCNGDDIGGFIGEEKSMESINLKSIQALMSYKLAIVSGKEQWKRKLDLNNAANPASKGNKSKHWTTIMNIFIFLMGKCILLKTAHRRACAPSKNTQRSKNL